MGDARQLSRLAVRADLIREIQLNRLPEPPPEMLKLPGVKLWYEAMVHLRTQDIEAFSRLRALISNQVGD